MRQDLHNTKQKHWREDLVYWLPMLLAGFHCVTYSKMNFEPMVHPKVLDDIGLIYWKGNNDHTRSEYRQVTLINEEDRGTVGRLP